jgi:hypothetical protein
MGAGLAFNLGSLFRRAPSEPSFVYPVTGVVERKNGGPPTLVEREMMDPNFRAGVEAEEAVIAREIEARDLAERNHLENERAYLASATEVYYNEFDSIELHMQSGVRIQIPRHLIDELADVPADTLRNDLSLAIGGDAISVRSRDVDIAIPGLLRDVLGLAK